MISHAHPIVSASLVVFACTVLISNAILENRTSADAFPDFKPRPTPEEHRRHAQLIGNWVGEAHLETGGLRRVLLQQFADGTFRMTFETRQQDDRIVRRQQVGQWGISGPVYFTITTAWLDGERREPTDLGQPYFYDAYRIVTLDGGAFEYVSFSPERRYRLQRVADDFTESDL
jgi:hypothetical protein